MKRAPPPRAWPKEIIEISSSRPDSRADPQATQKISREQLEEALKRTKSGTRRMVRSDPELGESGELTGPRDDGPEITIVRIDSVELETIDPSSLPAAATPRTAASPLTPVTPTATVPPQATTASVSRLSAAMRTHGLPITPRMAFLAGIAVAVFIALAAFLGFFAGRNVLGR